MAQSANLGITETSDLLTWFNGYLLSSVASGLISDQDSDPTHSMTSYKNYCQKSAKKIDDFLAENPELGPKHLQVLEKLNTDLEEQFKRMEISWFSMMDDIDDVLTHTALEKIFNDVDDYVTKTLGVSQKAISGKSSPTNAIAVSGHVKFDDTLKPRQELLLSFTLEEANIWFDGFTALWTSY